MVSSIFDVFADHMSDMAKYNALALPVLDAGGIGRRQPTKPRPVVKGFMKDEE